MNLKRILFLLLLFIQFFLQVSCSPKDVDKPEPRVYIKKTSIGYQLIRNGKPFFIKGASGNTFFKELKRAGGNTVRIYDTLNLGVLLDSAAAADLAVVVDVPIPRYGRESDTIYGDSIRMNALLRSTGNLVKKYKDHSAVLYWILGNEVYYPKLYSNEFIKGFNKLINRIHEIDPNHPVSTTVSSSGLRKVFSILTKSPELDFISVNNFGSLNDFKLDRRILFFWQKPYVISEWGNNGPWETETTTWAAPIEETGTKKAEQYKSLYLENIESIDDGRCMGSLAFYWGVKQERTHTWFSLFAENGKKSQIVFELENLWKGTSKVFEGPELNYVLLNGQSAAKSILLNSGEIATAELNYLNLESSLTYTPHWEIVPENWYYLPHEIERKPEPIDNLMPRPNSSEIKFKVPDQEGPYRLFVQVENNSAYYTTANIPFYVLKPPHEK